jgi:signal transduction histidine kinase
MHFPRSIRWRLQIWYGVLLVGVLSGFGFTAYRLESSRRFREIDEGLQERISALVVALRTATRPDADSNRRDTPLPPGQERPTGPAQLSSLKLTPQQAALFGDGTGYYFSIWMRGKEPLFHSANAPSGVPLPQDRDAAVRMRGEFLESFLFAAPVDCVLVGRSIAAEQADLRTLAVLLAAIGGAVLAAGLVVGWWLVTKAFRPVEDISGTAAKIATGDLSQRIDTTETDSELGRLATVLNSTFARLEAAFAQQARFTADAAHELRTPVSVMLTHAQNGLASECPNEEHREAFEAAQRAAQRMRSLIESLLELARIDAGQEPLRREKCDLSKITADCIELIRPLAAARRIAIHADLPATHCQGDAGRLAQVVTNLLGNAIDYNHDGGEVRIATKRTNGTATLTVSNTGPGIPAAELPHIFERFHRADKARTAGHSGLGLAIAQAIVRAHGGSIEAASEPGKGATFTVKLSA